MTTTKKAVAYVSDIILGQTGEVISRKEQKERIEAYAKTEGIEIKAWFEDKIYEEDILLRKGIQELLANCDNADVILVERIWSLSRRNTVLEGFFKEIEKRNLKINAATELWDCISQMARRRFSENLPVLKRVRTQVIREESNVKIRKPSRLNFVVLKKTTA